MSSIYTSLANLLSEHHVHQALVGRVGVFQPEGHNFITVAAPRCHEGGFCGKRNSRLNSDVEIPLLPAPTVVPTHEIDVHVLPSAKAQVGADALAQPSGSSTTLVPTDDKEQATESMPPPPTRRGIVLALCSPSATPDAPPKGRKRRCTRGNNGESNQ